MDPFLEQLRLDIPLAKRRSAYRVRVDNSVELDFFPDSQGHLNVITRTDTLPDPLSTDCLWRLLELNSFAPSHPNVSVGADQRGRSVQIWTRQPLHELDAKGAFRLLKLMLNALEQVNAQLAHAGLERSPRARGAAA
jgi:hypothetical protein